MSVEDSILNDVAIRDISEKVGDLQTMFNQLTYSHLPVAKDGVYLGCVSENDIRCFEADKTLEDYQYSLEGFFIRKDAFWLDILEAFAQNNTNLLPVLGEDNAYIGYVDVNDIITIFNETPFVNQLGNILVVEKGVSDYSFSEITQIVESNNAKLLGVFISKNENDLTQITLKISPIGMNEIIQSFRRYGYRVISEHKEDSFNQNLIDRSNYLDKYMNI